MEDKKQTGSFPIFDDDSFLLPFKDKILKRYEKFEQKCKELDEKEGG